MRPEWFKLWRRDLAILDAEILSMEDRGVIITNTLRYFDGGDLIPMSPVQELAFLTLKRSVDESIADYEKRREVNAENGAKGGRPKKPKKADGLNITELPYKEEKRREEEENRKEVIQERKGKEKKETKEDALALLKERLCL